MNDPKPSEKIFQAQVMQVAARYGWRQAHFRPSMTSNGRWLTAMSGDAGYPDLTLAHPTKGIIFAELKTDRGRVSVEQDLWHKFLHAGAYVGTSVQLWRPRDLDQIVEILFKGVRRDLPHGEADGAP
jgi:hypothetical protein